MGNLDLRAVSGYWKVASHWIHVHGNLHYAIPSKYIHYILATRRRRRGGVILIVIANTRGNTKWSDNSNAVKMQFRIDILFSTVNRSIGHAGWTSDQVAKMTVKISGPWP